ncbi:MAG: patatin-like phospholipase family protein [Acidobacteria bacterium]|nr:patatin-like phospholipase family protein [Acidobacteriota bacterium]
MTGGRANETGGAARKHAFILAGGGAYAAYQIGVVRALLDGVSPASNYWPLEPQIVVGASAGAFNAALLVSAANRGFRAAVDHLERTWLRDLADSVETCGNGVFRLRLNAARFAELGCIADPARLLVEFLQDTVHVTEDLARRGVALLAARGTLEQRLVELVDVETFISVEPFRGVIRRDIDPAAIRRSALTLRVAAINWKTGAVRIFGNADFTNDTSAAIIQAAIAIPGLFPSVDIDGAPYADASFVLNTPLKQAIDTGADVLHVMYFNPDVGTLPLPRVRNTVSTLNRAVLISLGAMMNRDIEIASRVNLALDVMRRQTGPALPADARAVVHEAGSRAAAAARGAPAAPHRPIEIHRYHTRESMGATFRWLSFGLDHLERLVAQGFEDTRRHDCVASGCIIPD